jgi:hypothetical protein
MYFIHRHKETNEIYGISLRENGAKLYQPGLGFGSFISGKFNSQDLDKIVEQHLAELAEIDRLIEQLDENELDPTIQT